MSDTSSNFSSANATLLDALASVVVDRHASADDLLAIFKRDPSESRQRLRRLSQYSSAGAVPSVEHRVPHVPFVLNGTLYDPGDVRRFDGQALHFVSSPQHEYLLAVDDANTMLRWWDLGRRAALERYQYGGYHFEPGPEGPEKHGTSLTPSTHEHRGPEERVYSNRYAYVYEHMDFGGDSLLLEQQRIGAEAPDHYSNLLWVSRGFLGLGDWNDILSSVSVEGGHMCVLYEHVFYGVLDGGDSLTLTTSENYLERLGWNDRVSSLWAT